MALVRSHSTPLFKDASEMGSAWFAFYPGDYLKKTPQLSVIEHGAFSLLLINYYATGRPLSKDIAVLYRIARAYSASERKAIDSVLSQYFILQEDGYHLQRADEELAKRAELHEKLSASGRKRWQQPSTKPGSSQAVSQAIAGSQSQPQSQLQKEESKTDAPQTGALKIASPEFLIFWNSYPRHEARKAALKAWINLGLDSRLGEVLAGLHGWKNARDPAFMPYAQGWLNQESWKDTPVRGKQENANASTNVPKSFDAARRDASDAAVRRFVENNRDGDHAARAALPAGD